MTIKYEAFDGTLFNTPEEAFDYEWREKYPNIKIFSADGRTFSSLVAAAEETDYALIYKVHNMAEKKFICSLMQAMYGDIGFNEMWQNAHAGAKGYIRDVDTEIIYTSSEALKNFLGTNLDPESDLAYALEEGY